MFARCRQTYRAPARTGGAVAQLGERYNGIVEVRGSIPLGSTNNNRGLAGDGEALVFMSWARVMMVAR